MTVDKSLDNSPADRLCIGITGGNSFVGKLLVGILSDRFNIILLGRHNCDRYFDLRKAGETNLTGIDILIHLAHDFQEKSFSDYLNINLSGTIELCELASEFQINKFIYVSSMSASVDSLSKYGRTKYAVQESIAKLGATIITPGFVIDLDGSSNLGDYGLTLGSTKFVLLPSQLNKKFYPTYRFELSQLIDIALSSSRLRLSIADISESSVTLKELIHLLNDRYNLIYISLNRWILLKIIKILELLPLKNRFLRVIDSAKSLLL